MFTLLKKGHVFAPHSLGRKDILIAGSQIQAIRSPGEIQIKGASLKEIDASEKIVIPGIIDTHVHILGGGGEGGPATRAPEITIQDIISSGVTSVIGCLGTDGTTRHMESLLAKARGLQEEGVSTYVFTGSYQFPVITITKDVCTDLTLIDKVLGAGEIAVSDHRSSQPTFEEFARLASQCRVGGLLGGKPGILHCHIGSGPRKLDMLFRLIKETEIPPTQVIPTHTNRNSELFEEAVKFIHQGGTIDITAPPHPQSPHGSELTLPKCLQLCQEKKAALSQITISSDSNGSLPVFDEKGQLVGLTVGTQKSLLENFRFLLQTNTLALEDTIRLFSTNPSQFYQLPQKGEIKEGKDADLILLNKDYQLSDCLAMGKIMMSSGKIWAKSTLNRKT
ncbi:beta-aspartyl-peptidase [bacterium]|nr:beta-aspartyl-peptidase [bacterium]